jgi:hypothetical protein
MLPRTDIQIRLQSPMQNQSALRLVQKLTGAGNSIAIGLNRILAHAMATHLSLSYTAKLALGLGLGVELGVVNVIGIV